MLRIICCIVQRQIKDCINAEAVLTNNLEACDGRPVYLYFKEINQHNNEETKICK